MSNLGIKWHSLRLNQLSYWPRLDWGHDRLCRCRYEPFAPVELEMYNVTVTSTLWRNRFKFRQGHVFIIILELQIKDRTRGLYALSLSCFLFFLTMLMTCVYILILYVNIWIVSQWLIRYCITLGHSRQSSLLFKELYWPRQVYNVTISMSRQYKYFFRGITLTVFYFAY